MGASTDLAADSWRGDSVQVSKTARFIKAEIRSIGMASSYGNTTSLKFAPTSRDENFIPCLSAP